MSISKILIVEDDADFAYLLACDIKKRGYQVVLAENGEDGLAKLKSEQPQLVIFDIKMPRMDGYSFVRAIKKEPAYAALPLIALTSFNMKDMFEIEGVTHYFMKTAKMEDLFQTLEKLLPVNRKVS